MCAARAPVGPSRARRLPPRPSTQVKFHPYPPMVKPGPAACASSCPCAALASAGVGAGGPRGAPLCHTVPPRQLCRRRLHLPCGERARLACFRHSILPRSLLVRTRRAVHTSTGHWPSRVAHMVLSDQCLQALPPGAHGSSLQRYQYPDDLPRHRGEGARGAAGGGRGGARGVHRSGGMRRGACFGAGMGVCVGGGAAERGRVCHKLQGGRRWERSAG